MSVGGGRRRGRRGERILAKERNDGKRCEWRGGWKGGKERRKEKKGNERFKDGRKVEMVGFSLRRQEEKIEIDREMFFLMCSQSLQPSKLVLFYIFLSFPV